MPNPDNTPQIPKNQSSITDDRTGMVSRDWYRFFLNLLNKANTGGAGGTVTSVRVSGGSTGLTTSGGPITTSGTITIAGTLAVKNGGTGATTATSARTNLSVAKSGANTDITSVALTSGTISTAPSASLDIVNKLYADSIASGVNFHAACQYATTTNITATYNNGSSGVGATLSGSAGLLIIDGYTLTASDIGSRILIKDQTTASENGVYVLTSRNVFGTFTFTRATDYDTSGSGTNEIDQGDFILIINGTANANTSWVQQTPLPITVGTTDIVFVQFGSATTVTSFSAGSTGFTPNSASSGTVTLDGTLGIANGGTNATTAIGALTSLGAYPASNPNGYTTNTGTVTSVNATVPSLLSVSGVPITTSGTIAMTYSGTPLPIANGGTNSTTAIGALTSLGAYPASNPNGYTNNTGTVTSVNVSGGTTGLTTSGGPVTTSGTVTLAGTLGIANGGTNATTSIAALTSLGAYPASNPNGYTNNTGTVTSVNATVPSLLSVSGVPITTSGTIAMTYSGTPLPIANGGTNATTSIAALTSLGAYPAANPNGYTNNTGTVTSVNVTVPSLLSVSGVPITTSGTVALTYSGTALPIANGGTGSTTLAGASIATYTGTETLTNKRINPRFLSQTSVATLAPDISAYDQYNLTAQAAALSVSAPIGTPVDGNKLIFRILDNGTARAITWNATYTVIGVTLPTTTVANKTTYVGCVYNANNTRWDVIAVTTQA